MALEMARSNTDATMRAKNKQLTADAYVLRKQWEVLAACCSQALHCCARP